MPAALLKAVGLEDGHIPSFWLLLQLERQVALNIGHYVSMSQSSPWMMGSSPELLATGRTGLVHIAFGDSWGRISLGSPRAWEDRTRAEKARRQRHTLAALLRPRPRWRGPEEKHKCIVHVYNYVFKFSKIYRRIRIHITFMCTCIYIYIGMCFY